jgi:spermidine synthase
VSERCVETAFWFREITEDGLEIAYLCTNAVYSGNSRFQRIDVVDTVKHGRMLFLEGIAQSAEQDEFIYHEMLVHPALFGHPEPKSVLLLGGAEGGALREIFRHPTVERVVMVDIDGELLEVCRRHLFSWHRGSFADPRLELVVHDGRKYLEEHPELFDVAVVDLSDPRDDTPAVYLFTREFYSLLRTRLKPGGCASVQGEGISPQEVALHARLVNTLKTVFPVVLPYTYYVYSYHRPDAHIFVAPDPDWSKEAFLGRVETARLPLRCFSADVARSLFLLPPYLYKAYRSFVEPITDAQPALEGTEFGRFEP